MRGCTFGMVIAMIAAVAVANAQGEIFSDGFESGDSCTWGITFPDGCHICQLGEFNCLGNAILECDAGPPAQWVPTGIVCDPIAPNHCNAQTGACDPLQVIGTVLPTTGEYYAFTYFRTGTTAFLGGYDVDSWGNRLYVNRGGSYLDVYEVECLDSDGDGTPEPNQHPDNPNHPGPIETRTLSHVTTHFVPELGPPSQSEIYALSDRVFFVSRNESPSVIHEYVFATGITTSHASGEPVIGQSFLGFGEVDGAFFSGNETGRIVYSLDPAIEDWVAEFEFPSMSGSHFDGLEVVVDPNTGIQYIYVSDMTSDYLGQYRRDPILGWVQENCFEYAGTGDYVEGMGFGALGHFWYTGSGDEIYEIGGGDLTAYLE